MSQLWVYLESLRESELVTLSSDEGRHVAARRLRPGDSVVAFDGAGHSAVARIETLGRRAVEVRIERVASHAAPAARWVLATAIPKGERLATMLPMLVQLGVPIWQPLVLEDSAVRDLETRSPRIQRILIESAKLARRPWLLEVREPCGLDDLLAKSTSADGLCFGDREGQEIGIPPGAQLVVIGPEAGFSADELRRLRSAGGRSCALGAHNMRIETAAVAAAAARYVAVGVTEGGAAGKGREDRDG